MHEYPWLPQRQAGRHTGRMRSQNIWLYISLDQSHQALRLIRMAKIDNH